MSDASFKTVVEVQADIDRLKAWLAGMTVLPEFTIEDYPIGRTDRGRCKLEVEYHPSKGCRTVRTTTDKHGRWCKPKKSTFHPGVTLVVQHPSITAAWKGAAWLTVCQRMAYLNYANGNTETIAEAPCWSKPRRTEETYTIRVRTFQIGDPSGTPPAEERTQHTLAADPPALCDAWDLWEREIQVIGKQLIADLNKRRKAVAS